MKLTHLTAIFVIIVVPISIVIAEYVSMLIGIQRQKAAYDNLLMGSTYDAIRAYQMNNMSDDYGGNNNSKERNIRASINSFYNSLATGLGTSGLSKENIQDYVPAMVMTMYDGYYVYGPYSNYATVTGGEIHYYRDDVSSSDSDKPQDEEYGLRPLSYYSCEYRDTGYDIIVNYTLDNYISVMGTVNGQSVSASGYYINPAIVTNENDAAKTCTVTRKDNQGNDVPISITPERLSETVFYYTQNQYEDNSLGYTRRALRTNYDTANENKVYDYIIYNNRKYYRDRTDGSVFTIDNNKREDVPAISDIDGAPSEMRKELQAYLGYDLFAGYQGDPGAYYYYKKAKEFSENIGPKIIDVKASKAISTYYNQKYKVVVSGETTNGVQKANDKNSYVAHEKTTFTGADDRIFDYNVNDPELEASSFNTHRSDVIISSVEYALVNAINNFNDYAHQNNTYQYAMPCISEVDWGNITNHECLMAFLQGLPIKNYSMYNSYSVVVDTITTDYVANDEINIQNRDADPTANTAEASSNDDNVRLKYEYHDPRCKKINENAAAILTDPVAYPTNNYERVSFTYNRKNEIGADGSTITDVISEPHVYYRQKATSAYECKIEKSDIQSSIGENTDRDTSFDKIIKGGTYYNNDGTSFTVSKIVQEAYLKGLAREKNAQYKVSQWINTDDKTLYYGTN